jgi:hypothetical protein
MIAYQERGEIKYREATPEELAAMQTDKSDWLHPYPIRIIAPKTLALQYPEIYVWFQLNNLPIEIVGDLVHLYCNEIMPEHQAIIYENNDVIKIEFRNG